MLPDVKTRRQREASRPYLYVLGGSSMLFAYVSMIGLCAAVACWCLLIWHLRRRSAAELTRLQAQWIMHPSCSTNDNAKR